MSTRADSTKKGNANAFNEANEALYDAFYGLFAGPKFSDVPWPEWNDAQLNAESWDEPKGKSTAASARASAVGTAAPLFEDFSPTLLPSGVKEYVHAWKRPKEVFPNSVLTVYDPDNSQFELRVPSPMGECEFFNCFNEILPMLQFCALEDKFPVEMETSSFVSTVQGEPWRPWHHVYALCKAGKGQTHKPLVCPYGKYIIRLFYMGSWRRFLIDDLIPCDKNGLCMLPVTQTSGELWPMLVVKGMLKVLSLTQTPDFFLTDFPMISLLTAWANCNITAVNKTYDQNWRRFQIFTGHYEVSNDSDAATGVNSMKDNASKIGSSKKDGVKDQGKQIENNGKFCYIIATLDGLPSADKKEHRARIVITMNRDTPLTNLNKREATKRWKRLRWVYWALEKGLWTDELSLPPYRRLQYVTFHKDLYEILKPDPNQEATLYAKPEKEEEAERSEENLEENSSEPLQWSDFYKTCEFMTDMEVLIKPSACLSNFKLTCLKNDFSAPDLSTPMTAKTATKPEPQNLYFYSPELLPSGNQPVLLFCESLTGIFICFSLSVCPSSPKQLTGYLNSGQPNVMKVGHAALIVERYDWRTVLQGELIGFVKTVGTSSFFLNLRPGRHLLRLWLTSDSPYALNLFSNVDVIVHKGPKIRFQMRNEGERVLEYIANISNAFISLTQKFGKSDSAEALREFYDIIKPGNYSAIDYYGKLDSFIESFQSCLMSALQNLITNVDELKTMLGALRSLFLNLNIECDLPTSTLNGGPSKKPQKKLVIPERTLSDILLYDWSYDEIRQIIMIQRIFRGYRVRLLFKCRTPLRKEFKAYTEKLKKICDTLFVPAKRDVEVGKIIRMIAMSNPDHLTTFRFHRDLANVLEIDEFTGKVANVEPFAWVPLARFVIACHSPDPVLCSFYFSCNLEQFVLMGVNNDTNEEIFALTNVVSPHYYYSNMKGYTILVFGWNEANVKSVNWRLEMVRMKHFQLIHLCNIMLNLECHPYGMPTVDVTEIKNFYVPNHKYRICRCNIKITKRSLLTLRMSTSFPDVQFVLSILLDKKYCNVSSECSVPRDKTIVECFSINGAVLLPSLVLENVQPNPWWGEADDDSTLYILEAYVRNDSWPLTKEEWGTVEPFRVNGETWKEVSSSTLLKKVGSESRKKSMRSSKRSVLEKTVENPFWMVQVINDSPDGDPSEAMTVEEDKSYHELIKTMKISWEEKNPGRRRRGKELRNKFLRTIYDEERVNRDDEGVFGESENSVENNELAGESFNELLHKMSHFSYLTRDKSPTRYSKSPRVLPAMPTKKLLFKYRIASEEVEVGPAMENQSFESSSLSRSLLIQENEEESRKDFLNLCTHYRRIMVNYIVQEQKLSNLLMEYAYKRRANAVQRMAV